MASPFHNRLDLKLHVLEYTDQLCGSLNASTNKPEYCDFDCPTLLKNLVTPPEKKVKK